MPTRSPPSPGCCLYKKQDANKAEWMRKLVDYCVTKGQSISDSMGYIPLPAKRRREDQDRIGANPIGRWHECLSTSRPDLGN